MAESLSIDDLSIDDLQDVLEATIDVGHLWFKMGLALKLRDPVLNGFAKKHYDDPDECYCEVLKEWLHNVPNPTWENVVTALRSESVRRSNIADKVAKDHYPHMQNVAVAVSPMQDAENQPVLPVTTVDLQQASGASSSQPVSSQAEIGSRSQASLSEQSTSSAGQQIEIGSQASLSEQSTSSAGQQTEIASQASGHGGKPLKLEWTSGGKALKKMHSPIDAVFHNNIAYFRPFREEDILTYCSTSGEWAKLTTCNVKDTTLAIVCGTLVTVGGIKRKTACVNETDVRTNDLCSFTGEGWKTILPSMSMKRSQVATVCNEAVLIVAGGRDVSGPLATVEVLNLDTKLWSFTKNLPQPVFRASSCICGNYLYVLGGDRDKHNMVRYACRAPVSDLLQYSDSSPIQGGDEPVFCRVEQISLENPACVTICGQLLAIGGLQSDQAQRIPSKFVYRYDPNNDYWQKLDTPMNTPRNRCFAVALSESTLMVVGGYTIQADVGCTDTVEFANLTV